MHDPRISALLRLKRFEQPPPGYFEQLLSDVHDRQRTELLVLITPRVVQDHQLVEVRRRGEGDRDEPPRLAKG